MLVAQNAQSTGTAEFASKEKQLYTEYIQLNEEVSKLADKLSEIQNRRTRLENHIQAIREKPLILTERNSTLWVTMIDHCIIHRDKSVTFIFRDGTEIQL